MGKERVSSPLRSMGLGIRSSLSADTDAAEAAAIRTEAPEARVNSEVRTALAPPPSQPRLGATKPHQMWPQEAGQEALSFSGTQREGLWAQLHFAPGWLCHHEQASWLLGWVLLDIKG